ncbi:4'-phosphopantetheinyl transferase superfamily protein [Streptomyces roseicoloratus]|uniref:4'-phosphopantetheinyl transferase superfamily protein n=1 Tax=Streptomyces roseicoloratus TaxID=2508722 RepID=A0ABY9RSV1_9ACTN|nr:4'-phosphopantetheinyl transferase superfamily protein [Streptomyces roseicoloratus]WMX45020.1 4'-phosphopantetheinyl transferase superfamily protein [Streptomyces roseicoloratus]
MALLDDAERRVYASFLREPDAALYVTAHALLRLVVGEALGRDPADLVFAAGPHGKPYLENARVEFSLSHAGERVAVAVTSDTPVGVDVERVPRAGAELPLHVLSPAERAAYDLLPAAGRAGAFTSYWVRKEAVLKATGEGLRVDPARLTVSAADRPAELLGWRGRKAVRGEAVQGKPYSRTCRCGCTTSVPLRGTGAPWPCWARRTGSSGTTGAVCCTAPAGRRVRSGARPSLPAPAGLPALADRPVPEGTS